MVYTVTFNPALNYAVAVEYFALGSANRTIRENIFYGGKGINVSTLLVNLGYRSAVLGFIVGSAGREIGREVRSLGFDSDFIQVEKGMSRINVKLKSDQESEINGIGPEITDGGVERLPRKLPYLKEGDVLALSGSVPAAIDNDTYQRIMEYLDDRGIRMAVDAEKDPLQKVLQHHPFLTKPNSYELGQMFGQELKTKEEVVLHARESKEQRAVNALISTAGDGAILVAEDDDVHHQGVARGIIKNSVGAGDPMVTEFIAGYLGKGDYTCALKLRTACGGATAFSDGIGTKDEIMRLLDILQPVRRDAFMRIIELLKKESIELGVKVSDKEEAIDRLVPLMDADGRPKDTVGYKEGILAREALGSMAIGKGVAIPHAKAEAVKEPGLAAMVALESVSYDAFDGSPANLLFAIAAPAEGADVHLEALSRLSTLLMNPGFKEGLIGAADKDEFLRIIDGTEVEHFGAPEGETGQNAKEDAETGVKAGAKIETGAEADTSFGYRVLAVTACPTGIAHTYTAAENLGNTGKKLGITLKAKTDGSGETQNVLTGKEIAAADAIITAADKNVEMARFDRKPVIMVPVVDGVHKAEELIKRTVDGTMPAYRHIGATGGKSAPESSDSIG